MLRLLCFLVIFGILLIQLHGLAHLTLEMDQSGHHCAICEASSQNFLVIQSDDPISSPLSFEQNPISAEPKSLSIDFPVSASLSRGPPQIL